jgi:thioredoxin 1
MNSALYVVFAIVGFFVFLRLLAWFNGRMKKGKVIEPFSGEISRKIQSGEKLLLYFYSPSCGACKAMTPVIDEMKRGNKNIYKINLAKESERKIGQIFGVMGTPATVLVENSKIAQFILGAKSKNFLTSLPV